ncbi:hypothetical protein Tco_1324042 [Tanacetum coccineum]
MNITRPTIQKVPVFYGIVYCCCDCLRSSESYVVEELVLCNPRATVRSYSHIVKCCDSSIREPGVEAMTGSLERGIVSMHRTKEEFTAVLKKISQFVNGMQDRLVEASPWSLRLTMHFFNKIFEHVVEPLSIILQLKPEKLARPTNVPASRDAYVSPSIANKSTVILASTSLEFLSNTVPTSFAVALEPNEEWVNAMVDGPDNEMVDAVANAKPWDMFVQGVSHVVDDVTELTVTGLERVSYGTGDVVVALSAREKGDGSVPSSTI